MKTVISFLWCQVKHTSLLCSEKKLGTQIFKSLEITGIASKGQECIPRTTWTWRVVEANSLKASLKLPSFTTAENPVEAWRTSPEQDCMGQRSAGLRGDGRKIKLLLAWSKESPFPSHASNLGCKPEISILNPLAFECPYSLPLVSIGWV